MDNFKTPAGLSTKTNRANSVKCDDCGRWADLGDRIRHSSRCDTPDLQAVRVVQPKQHDLAKAAYNGTAYGEGYDVDDLVDAVRCGEISVSAAMNQDM